MRKVLALLGVAVLLAGLLVLLLAGGWLGNHEGPGAVSLTARPPKVVAARAERQRDTALQQGVSAPKQILFGDLHVHTTFSFDAFMQSLPIVGGEGARPPADACDFARYCSALDFWSINDHAEGLTPRQWDESVDSIRRCNEVAGDPANPDLVAFLGWEWSQIDYLPETHYGHKNVVLRDTDDDRIPTRPIGSKSAFTAGVARGPSAAARVYLGATGQRGRDFVRMLRDSRAVEECPEGVPVRELPDDCRELVANPALLFAKLDDWGHESIVIPHGNAWGLYTPPGASWDEQLPGHDPERETLMEIYSGHGSSEEYRDFRATVLQPDASRTCPEPSANYLPACWRAGDIIEERCLETGSSAGECRRRAAQARQNHVDALLAGHRTVPGAHAADWLDAGQCRDCYQPAFNLRPMNTAQYMLALRQFDEQGRAKRFRMGFMGSSDNHTARAGSGYKELGRGRMTDGRGAQDGIEAGGGLAQRDDRGPEPRSVPFDPRSGELSGLSLFDFERVGSFMVTGGLIAAHSEGRDRESVWESFRRREVYATSGPRILLWFDLLNAGLPMGSTAQLSEAPHFRVRASGSLVQQPGCPEHVRASLGDARMHSLCLDECYNPSDTRRLISRIEVVRVRPQIREDEPIGSLIEDPWRVFECEPDPNGCSVVFKDPDFTRAARDAVYYVRAIEEPQPAINAGGLRCEYDQQGRCESVDPCGGFTPFEDDCTQESEARAWSSPIFVDFGNDRMAAR